MRDINYIQVTVTKKLYVKVQKLPRIINHSEFLRLAFKQPANMSVKLTASVGKPRASIPKNQRGIVRLENNIDWVLKSSKDLYRKLKYHPL